MNWINVYGVCILIAMLLPNIIYGIRKKNIKTLYQNRIVDFLEQIGRVGSMIFLVIILPFIPWGFASNEIFAIWLIAMVVLIALYWLAWLVYFLGKEQMFVVMALAILPTIIFVGSGIMMQNYVLLGFAIVFGVCHIFLTYKNAKLAGERYEK